MGLFDMLFGSGKPKSFHEMASDIVRKINRGLGTPVAVIDEVELYGEGGGNPQIRFMFGNGTWMSVPAGDAKTPQEYSDRVVKYVTTQLAVASAFKNAER